MFSWINLRLAPPLLTPAFLRSCPRMSRNPDLVDTELPVLVRSFGDVFAHRQAYASSLDGQLPLSGKIPGLPTVSKWSLSYHLSWLLPTWSPLSHLLQSPPMISIAFHPLIASVTSALLSSDLALPVTCWLPMTSGTGSLV